MASSSSSSPEICAAPTTITADNSSNYSSLDDVLEDLSSRFILNLPESELASVERICFQVEQAHWFYEDFVREGNPQFPSLPLKKFSQIFFHACPVLHQWSSDFEIAFNNFMQYKTRVPVCGAIMLNDTWEKCILVKGWKSSAGWGFPKGKINQDEERHKCAIREVYEETGYDLTGQIDIENVIELSIKQQKISLYIVPGVPEDYPFKTRTRKEISKIDWFKLSDLPTWKKSGTMSGKFYLISPFIAPLKNFIQDRKPSSLKRKARRARTALCYTNGISHPDESADSSLESPPHAHSIPDSTTHESSSQSSYADNTALQTPSPQYSQPRLNDSYVPGQGNGLYPTGETSVRHGETEFVHRPDPHLARLMESLSMSVVEKGSDNAKSPITQLSIRQLLPVSSTPVPTTPLSATSYTLMDATDASDWSSHAPRRVSDRQPSTTAQFPPTTAPSLAKPAYNPVHIDTSLSSSVLHSSTPYSLVNRPPSVAQPSVADLSLRHQRSVSSLSSSSRSVEVTPATKRMKQLALLESVADESARMTPTLEQQSGFHPMQINTNGISPPASRYPASMSPLQASYPASRQSVLYSSDPASSFSPTRVPSVPATLPPLYSVVGEDPFKVRPRNGEILLHTSPYHQMHNRFRQSMSETQLAPMLQRQQTQPSSSINYPPPHSYVVPAPPQVPPYPPHLPVRVPPMQVVQPQYLPVPQSFTSAPVSAPALLPHLSQPARNAQLLSILNANGPSHNPTGFQSSMTTPSFGVVNAVEHR